MPNLAGFRIPSALRRVPREKMAVLLAVPGEPRVGDIALVQVAAIGKNTRLELSCGRQCSLHEGDRLAAVFGNRYATMQFEGYVGCNGDACDMLSMGGVCGRVASKHDKVLEPSRLRLLGAIGDADGQPLRLRDFALAPVHARRLPRVLVVCGTDMDAGKTHTAMSVIIGLRRSGCRVAGVKLTGTAAGRDTWSMRDAGADPVFDFIDGGWPSTFLCSLDELLALHQLLLGHASERGVDWVVMEIADGLLQRETAALLASPAFTAQVDAWLFAAGSPLAAIASLELLRKWGIEPMAITGLLTMSPLSIRETITATRLPCLTAVELQRGALDQRLAEDSKRAIAAS